MDRGFIDTVIGQGPLITPITIQKCATFIDFVVVHTCLFSIKMSGLVERNHIEVEVSFVAFLYLPIFACFRISSLLC